MADAAWMAGRPKFPRGQRGRMLIRQADSEPPETSHPPADPLEATAFGWLPEHEAQACRAHAANFSSGARSYARRKALRAGFAYCGKASRRSRWPGGCPGRSANGGPDAGTPPGTRQRLTELYAGEDGGWPMSQRDVVVDCRPEMLDRPSVLPMVSEATPNA